MKLCLKVHSTSPNLAFYFNLWIFVPPTEHKFTIYSLRLVFFYLLSFKNRNEAENLY